jgi:hypothetical protein
MRAVRTVPFRRWSKTILTVLIVHTLYRDHSNDIDRSKNARGRGGATLWLGGAWAPPSQRAPPKKKKI